jgi:hypothetical protein
MDKFAFDTVFVKLKGLQKVGVYSSKIVLSLLIQGNVQNDKCQKYIKCKYFHIIICCFNLNGQ